MAVFYNVENIHPNMFLLNDRNDNDVQAHPRTCFCVRCRAIEVAEIHDRYIPYHDDLRMLNELRHMVVNVLPKRLVKAQERVFEITRALIVYGKTYKEVALKNNLTNESLTNLNARTFTVGKFREAVDFNWYISENERAR